VGANRGKKVQKKSWRRDHFCNKGGGAAKRLQKGEKNGRFGGEKNSFQKKGGKATQHGQTKGPFWGRERRRGTIAGMKWDQKDWGGGICNLAISKTKGAGRGEKKVKGGVPEVRKTEKRTF